MAPVVTFRPKNHFVATPEEGNLAGVQGVIWEDQSAPLFGGQTIFHQGQVEILVASI